MLDFYADEEHCIGPVNFYLDEALQQNRNVLLVMLWLVRTKP